MGEGFKNLHDSPVAQREFVSTSNRSSKKPNRLFFLLLFIGSVGLLLFLGKSYFSKRVPSVKIPNVTSPRAGVPTVESSEPTDIPISQAPKIPTDIPLPTINPIDKATGLDRSELTVFVRNGSGEVGAATKASTILRSFGYHVISIGNADNFDYQNISIELKTDKSKYLPLLQKDLLVSYTVSSASASLPSSASADSVVTVGK